MAAVAGGVAAEADVDPVAAGGVVLKDELVEGAGVGDPLHPGAGHGEVLTLADGAVPEAAGDVGDADVGGLAAEVLAGGHTPDGAVEAGAAVAAGDDEGHAEVVAEGLEDAPAKVAEVVDDLGRGGVVDVEARSDVAVHEFRELEVL